MPMPKAPPIATILVGNGRRIFGNHLYTAWRATGYAGPSARPSNTRFATSAASPTGNSIGSWIADHASTIASSTHRVGARLTRNPISTVEIEKKAKKLVPIRPNCV